MEQKASKIVSLDNIVKERKETLINDVRILQSQQWFRNCPVAAFRAYTNGDLIGGNVAFAALLAYESLAELYEDTLNLNSLFDYDSYINGNTTFKGNVTVKLPAGLAKKYSLTLYSVDDEPEKFEGFLQETTTSEAFKDLKADYEHIQEFANIVPFEFNESKKEMRWGLTASNFFKYTFADHFSFDEYLDIVHPEDRNHLISTYADARKNRTVDNMVSYRILDGDGVLKTVMSKYNCRFSSDGSFLGLKGWVQDISRISKAQDDLAEQLSILQTILDTVPVAIYTKNKWLEYQTGNSLFLKDAGLESLKELEGKTDFDLPWADDCAELMQADDRDILENREPQLNFENIITNSDGKVAALRVRKVPLFNRDGECIGILGAYIDVTREKLDQEKLLRAYEAVKESDKLKSMFLSNMSNQIRTPINAIVSFADMLGQGDLPINELSDFATIVQHNADRLVKIISDIIDLTLIDSKKLNLHIAPISIESILKEQFTTVKRKLKAIDSDHINVKLNLPDKNECAVFCDKVRVRQVLNNIIDNAIKYTEYGSIEMGLRYSNEASALVYIKDMGCGIDSEIRNKVFERFFTGRTSSNDAGMGIGLSLARELMLLMKGEIYFEQNEDDGTTFYLKLPSSC